MKTICLNMIVKNESRVIERCLKSVLPLINTWVIVDTGSDDGTQSIIRNVLHGVPGELYERPWVHFGHNRNEAMELARGKSDYLLIIDADDRLVLEPDFKMPELTADLYRILQISKEGAANQQLPVYFLVRNDPEFSWKGALHEMLIYPPTKTHAMFPRAYNEYINDGSRSKDPKKIEKDLEILLREVQKDPTDSHNVFNLARTYWALHNSERAMYWFSKRAEMGGEEALVYHSLHYLALCEKELNEPPEKVFESFAKAYRYRPSRAESIYEMVRLLAEMGQVSKGYALVQEAKKIPLSDDPFVEAWVWEWGIPLYLFLFAYAAQDLKTAKPLWKELLKNPALPKDVKDNLCNRYTTMSSSS